MTNRLNDILYHASPDFGDKLTRRDLLNHLMQECAEVIQAASKCLQYGYDRDWPGYGVNHEKLKEEIGQVEAIVDRLGLSYHDRSKIAKIAKWKKYMRENPEHGPQVKL